MGCEIMRKYLILVLLCGCFSAPTKIVEPVVNQPENIEYRKQLVRDLTAMSLRIYKLEQAIQDMQVKKRKKK